MDFLSSTGHRKELKADISIVSTSSERWEATNLLHSISGAVPQLFFKKLTPFIQNGPWSGFLNMFSQKLSYFTS